MNDIWMKEPPKGKYGWAKNGLIGEWVTDLTLGALFTNQPDTVFGPRIPSPEELAAMERVIKAKLNVDAEYERIMSCTDDYGAYEKAIRQEAEAWVVLRAIREKTEAQP